MDGEKLGTAILELATDQSGLDHGLSQARGKAKSWVSDVGGVLGKIAIGAAVFKGAEAVVGFLGDSISAAAEAEKVQAQLGAVLKSTGGAAGMTAQMVNDLATSLSQVTAYEDDTIVGAENLLLTFTGIGKDVFPQATETILDMSAALGQDLKSSAIQVGKALNDPAKGVSALQRVGVSFTEAQKKQIKTLVETGHVMEAQKLILKELNTEFGGAAKAAGGTFTGQMTILQNQIGNIKESIGGALLPVLTDLLSKATPHIIEFGNNLAGLLTTLSSKGWSSPEALKGLQALFGENAGKWIQTAGTNLGTFATNLGLLGKAITENGLNSPETFAALNGLLGTGAGVDEAFFQWQDFNKALTDVKTTVDNIKKAFEDVKNFLGGAEGQSWNIPLPTWEEVKPKLETYFTEISTWWDKLKAIFSGSVGNPFASLMETLGGLLRAVGQLLNMFGLLPQLPGIPAALGGGTTGGGAHKTTYGQVGPGFAGGTSFAPGGLAWVGERGPELVNIPRGSQVLNARMSEQFARGGVTANITINAPGGDPRAVARATEEGLLRAARAMGIRG